MRIWTAKGNKKIWESDEHYNWTVVVATQVYTFVIFIKVYTLNECIFIYFSIKLTS